MWVGMYTKQDLKLRFVCYFPFFELSFPKSVHKFWSKALNSYWDFITLIGCSFKLLAVAIFIYKEGERGDVIQLRNWKYFFVASRNLIFFMDTSDNVHVKEFNQIERKKKHILLFDKRYFLSFAVLHPKILSVWKKWQIPSMGASHPCPPKV